MICYLHVLSYICIFGGLAMLGIAIHDKYGVKID